MKNNLTFSTLVVFSFVLFSCTKSSDSYDLPDSTYRGNSKSLPVFEERVLVSHDYESLSLNFDIREPDWQAQISILTDSVNLRYVPITLNGNEDEAYLLILSDTSDTDIRKVLLLDANEWENHGILNIFSLSASNRFTFMKEVLGNGNWILQPLQMNYQEIPEEDDFDVGASCLANCFHYAVRSCEADPECTLNCYLAGPACEASMLVTCIFCCWFFGGCGF